jgi:hypothetical protein
MQLHPTRIKCSFIADGMERVEITMNNEQVSVGNFALELGAQVVATDGVAGHVEEFFTDPINGKITHLIVRRGQLWDRKDVAISVDDILRVEEDTNGDSEESQVFVKLDKLAIANLPAISV